MKQRWKEKNVLKRANFKMMKKLWSSKCWFSIHSYFSHSAKSRTKVGRKKYSLREGSKHEDFALREALAEIVNTTDFMKGYTIFWNFIYIEKGYLYTVETWSTEAKMIQKLRITVHNLILFNFSLNRWLTEANICDGFFAIIVNGFCKKASS